MNLFCTIRSTGAKLRQIVILFLGTALLLSGGCGEGKRPPSGKCLTAAEFARMFYLKEIPADGKGGYGFDADGARLLFYPGLCFVSFDGKVYSLPYPPQLCAQGLLIPEEDLKALPQEIRDRAAGVSMRKASVIIDAGHGGHDTGARGGGLNEKDITLDISRRLKATLANSGVPGSLTRNNDVYLTLEERARIANSQPGALFVSVHVNANGSPVAQGVETYFIADRITDGARAKLAADKYDLAKSGAKMNRQEEVQAARNMSAKYRLESEKLAKCVQAELAASSGQTNRGVRQENFAVLRGSFFGPAILIEVGFVSHPQTRARLATPAYRQMLAESIGRGVQRYLSSR